MNNSHRLNNYSVLNSENIWKYVVIAARIFFGGHAFLSGMNYFVEYFPLPNVVHPIAGPFVDSLTNMGLFPYIKAVEAIVGVCLLTNRLVPLALLLELPTSIVIFYMSAIVVQSERSMFTGPRELLLNLFLIAAYAGYYVQILAVKSDLKPLWHLGERLTELKKTNNL